VAVPPVRLRALAEHFAPEDDAAMMFSVCDADYRPALDAIADRIRRELGPTCVDICPADDDPTTPGLQPQCILTEVAPDGTDTAVPLCDVVDGHSALPAGAATCARPLVGVQRDPACGLSPVEIDVLRARDVERTPGAVLRATCTVSQTPGVDCPG
jgi:hypothetical protein